MTTSHCRNLVIWLEVSVRNSFYLVIHEASDYIRIFKIHRTAFSFCRGLRIIGLVSRKPQPHKRNRKVRIANITQKFHTLNTTFFRSKSWEFVSRKWLSGSFLIVFKTFNFSYNELHENSCFSMLESVLYSRSCLFCSNHQLWNS